MSGPRKPQAPKKVAADYSALELRLIADYLMKREREKPFKAKSGLGGRRRRARRRAKAVRS